MGNSYSLKIDLVADSGAGDVLIQCVSRIFGWPSATKFLNPGTYTVEFSTERGLLTLSATSTRDKVGYELEAVLSDEQDAVLLRNAVVGLFP